MSRRGPTDRFLELLAREGGQEARVRCEVFRRIVEAWAGAGGLPPVAGLRQLERGNYDARLPPEWKPVFVDVYRRWVGFRMDEEFAAGPPTLGLRWWLSPVAGWRGRVPEILRRLLSPIVLGLAGVALLAAILVPRIAAARLAEERLLRSAARAMEARDAAERLEARGHDQLADGSDEAVERFLETAGLLAVAADRLEAERDSLERALAADG